MGRLTWRLAGRVCVTMLGVAGLGCARLPAADTTWPASFPGHWSTVGRVTPLVTDHGVTLQNGFAVTKETWAHCDFSFRARATNDGKEVQIWAGIRGRDRDSRYIFGLRGGNNTDVYLARYAPDGNDKFLGLAPLDFNPVPGTWYKLRAVVSGNRFQIYLNDETAPRINVVDDAPLWQEGTVSLGGGWLPVEFTDVTVKEASAADADATDVWQAPAIDKEARRVTERAAYQPLAIDKIGAGRTEIPLGGNWLFSPDQELSAGTQPLAVDFDDTKWHVMDVPALWTPCLSWLYGETGWKNLPDVAATKGICDKYFEAEEKRVNSYTFDWQQTRSAWYREYVDLPADISGRHVELDFDAIAKISQVYVNGTQVGAHTGMFGEVKCDLSQAIHPGKNIIAVHVVGQPDKPSHDDKVVGVAVTVVITAAMSNSLPHGMFRDDASGIWQPVKLVVTRSLAVNDVYIKPKLDGADFDVELRNSDAQPQTAGVSYTIRAAKDGSVLYTSTSPTSVTVPAAGTQTQTLSTPTLAPKLWSPADPNLYQLEVQVSSGGTVLDKLSTTFGFRTFTTDKGRLMLNGKPYWLRGANHFPSTLQPNNAELAEKFMQLAHDGNVRMTRSHTVPMTETWLDAADRIGMGVSYEGTWPWLMLKKGPPPDEKLLTVWKDEYASLLHKYRNHPSILIWTVNNEMKFPGIEKNDTATLMQKWPILNDMIKTMRSIDSTRPIVADSSYTRQGAPDEFNNLIKPNGFDDGDIDDLHAYFGWYEPSFFHFFQGQLGVHAWPGRPLISQEMSTGYSENDDGHADRAYLFNHQTPQALIGNEAYENRDPQYFLQRQAFMTKELAETFRRADRADCSGIFHFSYITWFKDVWNVDTIQPFPTYYALRTALQPVLVSAELYGRHFYAGTTAHRRVCVVNDADDSCDLAAGNLTWEIQSGGKTLAQGTAPVAATAYYTNQWLDVDFKMPADLPSPRVDGQLVLKLESGGKTVSQNSYDITLASSAWSVDGLSADAGKIAVYDPAHQSDKALAGLSFAPLASLDSIKAGAPAVLIVGDAATVLADATASAKVKQYVQDGGKVVLLNAGKQLPLAFPGQIKGYRETFRTMDRQKVPSGEIATMHIPESPVFDGLEAMDMSWFELGAGNIPLACRGDYTIDRTQTDVIPLADECDLHGYLKKPGDMLAVSGSPLVEIDLGQGRILASEMALDAGPDDPIARRLLRNMTLSLLP